MRRKFRTILAVCGLLLLGLFLSAVGCGSGGRGYFSPDTLDCRTQREWLIPIVDLPIYRGPNSMHRYAAVDFLIERGFWAKAESTDPRWLLTFRWNEQWKDGYSRFHHELRGRGDKWVTWTNENPEIAAVLWPKVLEALRAPGVTGTSEAEQLMWVAEGSRSANEFQKTAAELLLLRPPD